MTPVWLSLWVGLAATLLDLVPAVAAAWVLARRRGRLADALGLLVLLPLVLPPVITGYLLLLVFSPRSALGAALAAAGLPVAFHWLGAVVAAAVVGFPLLVMLVRLSLQSIDPRLETAARSLGCSGWQVFWRITLPLAWPGVLAGALLCFARGLGEFGATIVLAGHVPGETETIALALHAALAAPGGERRAAQLCAVGVLLAVAAVLGHRALDARLRRAHELEG